MHTFFVNTSEKLKTQHHTELFECFTLSNELIVIDRYGLNELSACASEIADIITKDDGITDEYHIIVYADISGVNEEALAREDVVSIIIEENLLSMLRDRGHKPAGATVLFGESFTRGAQYGEGKTYLNRRVGALWKLMRLPDAEKVLAKTSQLEAARKNGKASPEALIADFKAMLLADMQSGAADLSLYENSALSSITIDTFAKLIVSNMHCVLYDTELLLAELKNCFDSSRNNRPSVAGRPVRTRGFRLEATDPHAWTRTEYRLLLYVCRCASAGSLDFAASDIDWRALAAELFERNEELKRELKIIELYATAFPMFNDALLKDNNIIPIGTVPPVLITEARAHTALTVKKLKAAAELTVSEIEEKDRFNDRKVHSFITQVSDSYGLSKEAKLKSCKYKSPDNPIENVNLTAQFIAGHLDEAEAEVANHKALSAAAASFEDIIKSTNERLTYFFDSLKRGWHIYVVGAAFVLLVALPYGIMQRSIFQTARGWLFFTLSLAGFAAVFTLGYLLFDFVCKRKIVKELRALCNLFATSQKERQDSMDAYKALLTHGIPLCYCLTSYATEFKSYVEETEQLQRYTTYHVNNLQRYIAYIDNTIRNLDIAAMLPPPVTSSDESGGSLLLSADVFHNDTVYAVVSKPGLEAIL